MNQLTTSEQIEEELLGEWWAAAEARGDTEAVKRYTARLQELHNLECKRELEEERRTGWISEALGPIDYERRHHS